MPTLGAAVNFSYTGTDGIASSIFTGKIFLEGETYAATSDEFQVRSATGALVTREFYNAGHKATLEYTFTGANKATAITNTVVPAPGTIVDITECLSNPNLDRTNWVVVGEPQITGSNTTARKCSLQLEAHAGVTAVAT